MPGSTIIIKSNGDLVSEDHEKSPGLDFMQAAVGGYIEQVPLFTHVEVNGQRVRCDAFCNEEGKLHGLPLNSVATRMWQSQVSRPLGDVLVGDILLVIGDAHFRGEV